jgi:pantetheine-phosphate adenylyltransferase
MADPRHQAIASKLVKEIAVLGGEVAKFVSPSVKSRLLEKIGRG